MKRQQREQESQSGHLTDTTSTDEDALPQQEAKVQKLENDVPKSHESLTDMPTRPALGLDNKDRKKETIAVHWFRHGLRLHDNPSLIDAINLASELYPIFIFDGEVAGTKVCGFNRWRFLYESLEDIDRKLKEVGGRLYTFNGDPCTVFNQLIEEWGVNLITFEQDPEPIWQDRDNAVKRLCEERGIRCIESVSHTLWDPNEVTSRNGGTPPVTYAMFQEVVSTIGLPHRPSGEPDFSSVKLSICDNFDQFALPHFQDIAPKMEHPDQERQLWIGGETRALELFEVRVRREAAAFKAGYCLPNQYMPDLLGPPMSLSPYLRFGCLSVRKFYWRIHDTYTELNNTISPSHLTAQLIWREYFYTMSVGNKNFDRMNGNNICLKIDWSEDQEKLQKWTEGETGYPWIDACMKQLKVEGWIHQVARHAVACFLTRGDLWISWEDGLKVFYQYLLDADWSICAGNWMWISSSAFEKVLQCPNCFCPVRYGRRMDPNGEFVRRFLPVLVNMPLRYLFEPWKAPLAVQEKAGCIIGKDYPMPIVEHRAAASSNREKMNRTVQSLEEKFSHCTPSNEVEVREFSWLPETIRGVEKCTADDLCEILGI
ncbi:cryptochrome-1-like isoform X1 [Patiria miniata]|uniref:Cryptochrome-1 n=2 Tax=Patiria miniata TaxID=46514 RepID=A0A914B9K8_PATMI|nr:cryptochrome-1-like isoform X1 [Patiria miniata]